MRVKPRYGTFSYVKFYVIACPPVDPKPCPLIKKNECSDNRNCSLPLMMGCCDGCIKICAPLIPHKPSMFFFFWCNLEWDKICIRPRYGFRNACIESFLCLGKAM